MKGVTQLIRVKKDVTDLVRIRRIKETDWYVKPYSSCGLGSRGKGISLGQRLRCSGFSSTAQTFRIHKSALIN